jgi:putative ABC transport system permease protein
MRAILPDAKYAEHEIRRRFVEEVERRLAALPGVRSVAIANVLPATSSNAGQAIEIEGIPVVDRANPPRVDYRSITPAFFETLRIPVLQGRGVASTDTTDTQRIAVISRSLADRHFRGEEPIGRRIKLGNGPWLTIVGITGDVIHGWFDRRNAPTAYVPYAQSPTAYLGMAVRADGDLDALVPAVRSTVRSVDAAQPLFDVMPMPQLLHERTIGLQYVAAIMAVFGGLALLLAVVGVYSVMAFVITQRTPEIGVRIALGASRADVLRLTIGQSASITAVGIAVGLGLSYALGRVMEAALFGTVTADAWVSLTLAAVLVAAAVLAGYVPARRATSIDPMIALRN